jgi:DNA-directed RNA polymerase specialized sigma24 family protein
VQLTEKKVVSLLKGYRTEYPYLSSLLQEELSKEYASREIIEGLESQLALYDCMVASIMDLDSRTRPIVLKQYISDIPSTGEEVASFFGISETTQSRRVREARKQLLILMNSKLNKKGR